MKTFFLATLILSLSILTGCTLYKSTTENISPATEGMDKQQHDKLRARVIELEQRVKVLEEKLQGQW